MEDANNNPSTLPPQPPQDDVLRMDDEQANNGIPTENEDKQQSPLENIIPLEKLKNGWFALSGFVQTQATAAYGKGVEAYNSETAQAYRRKSVEVYEKTCEAAAPMWESTKSTAYTIGEKTKEGVAQVAESLKPTIEVVGEKMSQAVKAAGEATAGAAEYAQHKYEEAMGSSSSSSSSSSAPSGSSEYTPSALDSATKGGPTVL